MFPTETRFLIVDDEPVMRAAIRSQLTELGFTNIREACDGVDAFQKLEKMDEAGSPCEIIISDWNMPNMNGLDFLKKAKGDERFSAARFIFVTSQRDMDQVASAIMFGVNSYVIKPLERDGLRKKLQAVWDKELAS